MDSSNESMCCHVHDESRKGVQHYELIDDCCNHKISDLVELLTKQKSTIIYVHGCSGCQNKSFYVKKKIISVNESGFFITACKEIIDGNNTSWFIANNELPKMQLIGTY